MKISNHSYVLFAAILAASATPAPAADCKHWQASSRTAMAITGDITACRHSVAFANGTRLKLKPQGTRTGPWMTGRELSGAVYRVQPPSEPVLENGNTLCVGKVRYLVMSTPPTGGMVMSVFTNDLQKFCGLYYYD